ncbi:MAG: dynamin family protein, partial [Geodermatophilaceae bacterium]
MSTPAPPQQANSGSPGGRTIGAEVRALVTDVVNLANHLAEPAAAELLAGRAASADTTATIVVAGEAKQGKSTLVNCLLTSDGLSPVDADIATAAALRFRHGPELGVVVNLVDGRQISIDPAELPSWISMADAELERLRQVSSVEVTVPSALLEPGLVLVD